MDKYLIKPPALSTLELLEEPVKPVVTQQITLGFLGNSAAAKWTRETIAETIMNPLIGEIERLPDTILMPSEGNTSILLNIWADRQNIPCQPIDADWARMGRKARIMRDARILKEATHLIFFLGTRSDYYEKMAIREAKKGKVVFTVDAVSGELVQWVL
jgi:hypothetical protein